MRILFIVLLTLPVSLLAQKEVSGQFIYTGLNYSPYTINRLLPTLGFYQVDKRNNLIDFQLNQISYRKRTATDIVHFNSSYHKIIGLNKKSDSQFYLGLGLGVSLYYTYLKRKPVNSTTFLIGNTVIGAMLSVKPVINYSVTDKFFLGFSTNVGVLGQSIAFTRYENPAIPIEQQKDINTYTESFDRSKLNFNVIVGFKIN